MNIKSKLLNLGILSILLLFSGCNNQQINTSMVKQDTKSSAIQQKVSKAFIDAKDLEASYSKWFNKKEKLPLTIIATAYMDPDVTDTKEYQQYINLIKKIQKDIKYLDKLSGKNLSNKYSSIRFIDFDKSDDAQKRFNVAYSNRYNDKSILTDALRPDKEKPSQELLIRLNIEELKKGNLTIEGYKTVKQKDLKRNSYYYTLRKTDYSKLNKKQKLDAIINSLLATLQLSIPQYVSIDRKEIVNDGEMHRFILPTNKLDNYKGIVYFHESDGIIGKLQRELQNLKDKKAKEGKVLETFQEHKEGINSLAISLDDKYILSTGNDNYTLKLWDLDKKKTIQTFIGHTFVITSVAITPDKQFVVSGSLDKTIKLWNIKTGENIKTFKGDTSYIRTLAITPDAKYIISGSDDKTIKVWDIKTGENIKTLKGHKHNIYSVIATSNGKNIISASEDKTIKLWDIKTGKNIRTFKGHKHGVNSIAVTIDGKYIVSGSDDKTIKLWNIKTGKNIKTFKGNKSWISSVSVSDNGKFIISGSINGELKLWDIKTGKVILTFKGHTGVVTSAKISHNERFAISGARNDDNNNLTLKLWGLPITKEDSLKLNTIPSKIEKIKKDNIYLKYQTKQNILTSNLYINDINILTSTKYIKIENKNKLNLASINKIANSLNCNFNDPIVSTVFSNSYGNATNTTVSKVKKALFIQGQTSYNLGEIYFSSYFNYKDSGYKVLHKEDNIKDVNKAFKVIDKKY